MTEKATKTKVPASEAHSPATCCKTRFICALQSTGRVGKSTAIHSLASYLDFAGVTWDGVDADPEHRSFSSAFPEVAQFPLTSPESLDQIFRHADSAPVCLADSPAGATESILDHLKRRQVLTGFAERGVKMTVLLFSSPDPTAEASFRAVFTTLKSQVDFIVVQNDARFSSARFASSPAAKTLAEPAGKSVSLSGGRLATFFEPAGDRVAPHAKDARRRPQAQPFGGHRSQHLLLALRRRRSAFGLQHPARPARPAAKLLAATGVLAIF